MNIDHIWSIACSTSIVDQNQNNVSLMNVIEQFNVDIPSTHKKDEKIRVVHPFDLVTLWQRKGDTESNLKAESRIRLVDWRGTVLMSGSYGFELPKGKKRGRAISKFPGVEINSIGNHKFLIDLKEEGTNDYITVYELPLEIRASKK